MNRKGDKTKAGFQLQDEQDLPTGCYPNRTWNNCKTCTMRNLNWAHVSSYLSDLNVYLHEASIHFDMLCTTLDLGWETCCPEEDPKWSGMFVLDSVHHRVVCLRNNWGIRTIYGDWFERKFHSSLFMWFIFCLCSKTPKVFVFAKADYLSACVINFLSKFKFSSIYTDHL